MNSIFVEVDLVQAEWVVTAYASRDARMLDVVKNKRDPHLRTGSLISNAPEGFVRHEAKLVGHLSDPDEIRTLRKELPGVWEEDGQEWVLSDFFLPRSMSIRQAGKKSNHGLNYDMKYKRFALENEMDESDAKRIEHLYKNVAYKGLLEYYKDIERELKENGRRLTNCFGQTRRFDDRWGPELLNAAYSFKPQSTVGNVTNFGLRRIYKDSSIARKVEPCAQVHDSILNNHFYRTPEELCNQLLVVDRHMTTTCSYHYEDFELRREYKIGKAWGEGMQDIKWEAPDGPEALHKALQEWEATVEQAA